MSITPGSANFDKIKKQQQQKAEKKNTQKLLAEFLFKYGVP